MGNAAAGTGREDGQRGNRRPDGAVVAAVIAAIIHVAGIGRDAAFGSDRQADSIIIVITAIIHVAGISRDAALGSNGQRDTVVIAGIGGSGSVGGSRCGDAVVLGS